MAPSVSPEIPFYTKSSTYYCLPSLGSGDTHWSGKSSQSSRHPNACIDKSYLQRPTSGAGICRILTHASHENLAFAVLARNRDNQNTVAKGLRSSTPNPVHAFPTDTPPEKLSKAFSDIHSHGSFEDLKFNVAVFHIKHAHKNPF